MESPIFTYMAEIAEPSIRGVLTASASIAAALGITLVLFIGSETSWRNAALICASLPIFSIFALFFVSGKYIRSQKTRFFLIINFHHSEGT